MKNEDIIKQINDFLPFERVITKINLVENQLIINLKELTPIQKAGMLRIKIDNIVYNKDNKKYFGKIKDITYCNDDLLIWTENGQMPLKHLTNKICIKCENKIQFNNLKKLLKKDLQTPSIKNVFKNKFNFCIELNHNSFKTLNYCIKNNYLIIEYKDYLDYLNADCFINTFDNQKLYFGEYCYVALNYNNNYSINDYVFEEYNPNITYFKSKVKRDEFLTNKELIKTINVYELEKDVICIKLDSYKYLIIDSDNYDYGIGDVINIQNKKITKNNYYNIENSPIFNTFLFQNFLKTYKK